MRVVATSIMVLALATAAFAQSRPPPVVRPEVYLDVPLAAPTPGVVFPFGGTHHAVPGVVAVNRAPYVCARHGRPFRDRAAFVEHLRRVHHLDDAAIGRDVVVRDGQARYVGD